MVQNRKCSIVPKSGWRRLVATDAHRRIATAAAACAAALLPLQAALSQADPPGCTAAPSSAGIEAFHAEDLTTGIDWKVFPGQEILYRLTLSHPGPPFCNYEGGTLTVTFPNGSILPPHGQIPPVGQLVQVAGFPMLPDVPLVSLGNPFNIFAPIPYTVNPADAFVNAAGQTVLVARIDYGCTGIHPNQECGHVFLSTPTDKAQAATAITLQLCDPSISIEKSTDTEKVCPTIPTEVTYTYLVTNTGNCQLDDITVTDDTCAPVNCPLSSLAPGASMTCSCTTTIDTTVPVTNLATVVGFAIQDGNPLSPYEVSNTDTETVDVNPPITCVIEPEGAKLCDGQCTELCADAGGGRGNFTYFWSTGETTECIEVCEPGTYWVEVEDENGCKNLDPCEVEVTPGADPVCSLDAGGGPNEDVHLGDCPETGGATGEISASVGDHPRAIDEWNWSVTGQGTITGGQGTSSITYELDECNNGGTICATFHLTVVDDHGCASDQCSVEVCCTCPNGGEGCTPGFWMQPHHCGHWPCDVNDVAGSLCPDNCPGGPATGTTWNQVGLSTAGGIIDGDWTLDHVMRPPGQMKQQLGIEPGQLRSLIFHTIAALLNAGSDDVAFGMSVQGVVDNFNDAVAAWLNDGDVNHLLSAKNIVADLNEQGCPLSGHADLVGAGMEMMEDGFVDMNDLMYVVTKWGTDDPRADVNDDGTVNIFDLLDIFTNWGPQTGHWKTSFD